MNNRRIPSAARGRAASTGQTVLFREAGRHNPQLARAVRCALLAVPIAAAPAAVFGQAIEEIVVTATKREASVQDVPLAITAFSGEFSAQVNLNDVKDLISFTPGVSGNSQDSFIDAVSVRGIRTQDFGVGGDPSAAFFKNDLYEGRNGSAVTSLYDMERSEVLRGPQGFLFGRNSIGGAFSVHTAKARIGGGNTGYLELDVGERSHVVAEGAVNVPVNDNFAMRFAGYYSTEDGFARNFFNGNDLIEHDKQAIRWSTSYESDRLGVQTMLEYESREQSGSVYRAIDRGDIWETFEAAVGDLELAGSDEDIDSDQLGGDNDDADILTLGLRVDYDFDRFTLTSNTGFKDHDYFYNEDYDGTPLSISSYGQDQTGDYFQTELRLTSSADGPFSWYAGVSYYQEDIDARFSFIGAEDNFCAYYGNYYYPGNDFTGCIDLYDYYEYYFTPQPDGQLVETGRIIGDYSGWAAYVDLSYAFSEAWDVSLGFRYSKDDKDFSIDVPTPDSDLGAYWAYTFSTDGPVNGSDSWDDVTTRLVTNWRPNDDTLIFGSYTEGFKAGGFGSFALLDADGNGVGGGFTDASQADGFRPNAFQPETVDSLELGYKGTLWDGRAQLNLTAFTYDYEDLQVVVFDGGAAAVENVGQVDGQGFEASVNANLSETWSLYLAMGWLDTEATNLQDICGLEDADGCEGSELFWAPDFAGAMVINGYWPFRSGEINASLEWTWESERGGGFEGLQETMIDSYNELNFRIGYDSGAAWSADLYVENLTDEFTWDGLNNNGGVLPSHFFGPKRPRTTGVRVRWMFE